MIIQSGLIAQLFERYRSFASDSEKEGISTSLQQTEEWLYEDGDDETEKVYASKLEDLKKVNTCMLAIGIGFEFWMLLPGGH